ncbi:MAG: G5 domain-containing protein [Anaerolineales bacterium]
MLLRKSFPHLVILITLLALALSGCRLPFVPQAAVDISVSISADGTTKQVQVPPGSTGEAALKKAGVTPGQLDKIAPPLYTILGDGDTIKVTRVIEKFETQQTTVPFERQTVHNESMAQGATRLIQPGVNGQQELTYRHVYEDGKEVSNAVFKTVVLQAAVPEIVMVGVQAPFAPLSIPGKLVYIASGNAWSMETSTANRVPLVTTGDLDGRILKLSNDGNWLLYTRKSTKSPDQEINTLWALEIGDPKAKPISMGVSNVIHFADFDPQETLTVDYSTVEPRAAAPGWQANNNLLRRKYGRNGVVGMEQKIIDSNTGGVYGWWGTAYAWSQDGKLLAYSRPDGVGYVSIKGKTLVPLLDIVPLQTHSDWALIPGIAWGADSNTLYVVTHAAPPGLVNPEESPNFDLSAIFSLESGANVRMVTQTGMFAYPAASPTRKIGLEQSYSVAYLQAQSPAQSESSGYRLVVMDRDGSNHRALFPDEGSPGLAPQTPFWAPAQADATGNYVAVIYQGNLYLVDATSGIAHQVTGDGLIQKIDWK